MITLVAARDTLVSSYLYLCERGARKFLRPGLERSDLKQVATIGLLKACDRYDPSLQTPFEAYAWLFIVGELMHHVRDFERIVRPPRKLRSLERKWQHACDEQTVALGRGPTDEELARALGTDLQTIGELRQCRARAVTDSLDVLNAAADEDRSAAGVDALLDRLLIDSALAELSATERKIILGVYAGGYSQLEVARRLGYSQRHVSRLHKAALQKMLPVFRSSA
ncbi:MAG: hypothetical protein NVS9B12_11440 [Vulcanimicrobiaceae bacterium]